VNNKRKAQYRNNQAYGEKKILCVRCPKKSKHISRAEIGGELLCFKHYAEALAEERVRKTGSAAFTLPTRDTSMWTETYAQMMDRAIIERIKQEEFSVAVKTDQAIIAGRQAQELEEAARQYINEALEGDINHIPHEHLRFHDHGSEVVLPSTVEECLAELRRIHALYWVTQTRVQELKKQIPAPWAKDELHPQMLAEFFQLQLVIDDCNQRRNEVRSHCDVCFASEYHP